jgi:hypothetical protein
MAQVVRVPAFKPQCLKEKERKKRKYDGIYRRIGVWKKVKIWGWYVLRRVGTRFWG